MSKQPHFYRLRRLRNRDHDHSIYEWLGVENFFQDFEILEQIGEEIAREMQSNYISPYSTQSRGKTEEDKIEARSILSETLLHLKIVRDPTLKADYDYELEKELRKKTYYDHIARREREATSRANNPNVWAPEKGEIPATSDSKVVKSKEVSDESIDAPAIVMSEASSDPDVPVIDAQTSINEKWKPAPSIRKTAANRARYRQRKKKQRQQMVLIFFGSIAGILIGFLLLKALNL